MNNTRDNLGVSGWPASRSALWAMSGLTMSLVAVSLMTACGDDPTPTPEVYATPTPSVSQGEPFTTTGTFAGKFVISQYVENVLTVLNPDDYEQQLITTYSVVTIRPGADANTLIYREDNCTSEMTEVAGATSTLNPEYYTNTPVDDWEVAISEPFIGATFNIPETIVIKGANLTNPATEALPSDPEDPRLYDFDEDGNPGYTVHVSGAATGDLYASERFTFSYSGTIVTDDLISGLIYNEVEDVFVQSTSVLIPTDTDTKPDDVVEHSFFELKRVADGLTCQQLEDQASTLFPQ